MTIADGCACLASRDQSFIFRDVVLPAAFAPGFIFPEAVAANIMP